MSHDADRWMLAHDALAAEEAARLRSHLYGLNPLLAELVDAAAQSHARRVVAERRWAEEGSVPESPWLKMTRDALRDYQAALKLLLRNSDVADVADPLGINRPALKLARE